MSNTVRKQKSGDQLTVGDWLAPGELLDGATEVLHVLKYRPKDTIAEDWHVHLVVREQGMVAPYADIVAGNWLASLASDEDLAEYREAATRMQMVERLRVLANLFADRKLPVPSHALSINGYFEKAADVQAVAEALGVDVTSRGKNQGVQAKRTDGAASWEPGAITLDFFTVRDEPEPDADPTGLAYSRADDVDDPTPVSGARVEPHVGAVTESGLVDETSSSMRRYFEDGRSNAECSEEELESR